MFYSFVSLLLIAFSIRIRCDECQFLTMCKCTNFPLFALYDATYLSKPRSTFNQDLFCSYSNSSETNNTFQTFEQLKYFYYRFRTLTFAHYPDIPSQAFRFVHFEPESVKQTPKINNRNVIALINIERTHPNLFAGMNLPNAEEQLLVAFLNAPRMVYAPAGLAQLRCVELKLQNTPNDIPIDFFRNAISIGHLIIQNPSFTGFLPSSTRPASFHFQLNQLSIKDIAIRHLRGKHFPIAFPSLQSLTLENIRHRNGFRSWDSQELSERFPQLKSLTLFSSSLQRLPNRAFEHLRQLEYLTIDGISTVDNEAFFNLHHLKQLDLGRNLRHLDPYAFLQMNPNILLLLNQSLQFTLDDEKDFCTFAQFSATKQSKFLIRFPPQFNNFCPCTLRYLYRHIEKSLVSFTPSCYSNASVYILTQEERICYFEQRLLQCDILPNEGITIYGQHYNVSYFYQKQLSKGHKRFAIFFRYRVYYVLILTLFVVGLLLIFYQQRKRRQRSCPHLDHLLKHGHCAPGQTDFDVIYHPPDERINLNTSRYPRSTKV